MQERVAALRGAGYRAPIEVGMYRHLDSSHWSAVTNDRGNADLDGAADRLGGAEVPNMVDEAPRPEALSRVEPADAASDAVVPMSVVTEAAESPLPRPLLPPPIPPMPPMGMGRGAPPMMGRGVPPMMGRGAPPVMVRGMPMGRGVPLMAGRGVLLNAGRGAPPPPEPPEPPDRSRSPKPERERNRVVDRERERDPDRQRLLDDAARADPAERAAAATGTSNARRDRSPPRDRDRRK
jgi:hypothetical protein